MFLGIDFGRKRIGLALGEIMPRGAGVLDGTRPIEEVVSEIAKICEENDVEGIVIGHPIKKSGEPGEIVPAIEQLSDCLKERLHLPIYFEEEELTSREAESIFANVEQKYDKKSGKVDELAAVLILEQYLNRTRREGK